MRWKSRKGRQCFMTYIHAMPILLAFYVFIMKTKHSQKHTRTHAYTTNESSKNILGLIFHALNSAICCSCRPDCVFALGFVDNIFDTAPKSIKCRLLFREKKARGSGMVSNICFGFFLTPLVIFMNRSSFC